MPDQLKIADSGVKNISTTQKLAFGAAVVALSGLVPQPFVQDAHADSAAISVTGAFSSGITMTAGVNAQFGTIVPTGSTGNVVLATAGTTTPTNAFNNGGTLQAGTIAFNAGAGGTPVDITVAGFGTLTLGGAGAAGTATLDKVYLGGPFASQTLTGGAGTATDTILGVSLSGTTGAAVTTDIDVGARVSWAGNLPVGTFSQSITVTVSY